jgi:hypothetical protein
MKLTNRKFWLFLIALAVITVLSFFGKDTSSIITLFAVYVTGNVGAKFSVNTIRKEE